MLTAIFGKSLTLASAASLAAFAAAAQPLPPQRPRDGVEAARRDEDHPLMTMPFDELRPRLRACAEEWSGMKRAGSAAGRLWSDFSRECLTRK